MFERFDDKTSDESLALREKYKRHFPHRFPSLENQKNVNWHTEFDKACADEYEGLLLKDDRELFLLIKDGDIESLKSKIITLVDLRKKDKNGISLLEWAQRIGDQRVLDFLYQVVLTWYEKATASRPNIVGVQDNEGRNILHWDILLHQNSVAISSHIENLPELKIEGDRNEMDEPSHVRVFSGELGKTGLNVSGVHSAHENSSKLKAFYPAEIIEGEFKTNRDTLVKNIIEMIAHYCKGPHGDKPIYLNSPHENMQKAYLTAIEVFENNGVALDIRCNALDGFDAKKEASKVGADVIDAIPKYMITEPMQIRQGNRLQPGNKTKFTKDNAKDHAYLPSIKELKNDNYIHQKLNNPQADVDVENNADNENIKRGGIKQAFNETLSNLRNKFTRNKSNEPSQNKHDGPSNRF